MTEESVNTEVTEEEVKAPVAPVKEEAVKYGIQNIKEVLRLGFGIAKAGVNAKINDGVIDANDMMLIVPIFPLVGPALEDISLVPKELKDLDAVEIKEIMVFAAAFLGGMFTDKEDLINKVEKALAAGLAIIELVASFKTAEK